MSDNLKEATPIGRLLGAGGKTLGWVYLWNTSEISILWLSEVPNSIPIFFAPQPGCDHATREDVDDLLKALRGAERWHAVDKIFNRQNGRVLRPSSQTRVSDQQN